MFFSFLITFHGDLSHEHILALVVGVGGVLILFVKFMFGWQYVCLLPKALWNKVDTAEKVLKLRTLKVVFWH